MKTVRQMISEKNSELLSVAPNETVFQALDLMREKDIGALLVLEDDQLVGIFSERDYARKVILLGKASKDTHVSQIMTSRVVFVKPENSVDECMALMTQKRIRHLPVVENGNVVGVISIGDIVKEMISEQQFIIEQLEQYIRG